MFRTEFIKHEDSLYVLKRKFKEEYRPNIEAWKEVLGADKVLKKDGVLYFVELIPEAEVIEDDQTLQPLIEESPKEELKQESSI
jgi:hypothetical protein